MNFSIENYIEQHNAVISSLNVDEIKQAINLIASTVKNGKRVGIVSFGTGHIIQAYMNRIFGVNQLYFHRNNILALCRDEKGKPMEYLNNKIIYHIY